MEIVLPTARTMFGIEAMESSMDISPSTFKPLTTVPDGTLSSIKPIGCHSGKALTMVSISRPKPPDPYMMRSFVMVCRIVRCEPGFQLLRHNQEHRE